MKQTLILLIVFFWGHWSFAELPQSLDEVLFGISGGTNYVKWMRTDGMLKFDRPFVIFNWAHFRMHYPTNDFAPRHYSIEMEHEFPDESSSTNLVDLIQKAESILLKIFKGRSFKRQYDGNRYQSYCVDIDGLGWDACFYIVPLAGTSNMCFVARSKFYNSLHREGRHVSCEDLECDNSKNPPTVQEATEIRKKNSKDVNCSKDVEFIMYAPHYAKKGYCRSGLNRYGVFLDYSFGRTNYCDSTAFGVIEGTNKFLCVTNTIGHISKDFDVATLYHDAKSRRLFRVSACSSMPDNMSVADRIKFLNSISKAFDYMYRIKVPIPVVGDIDALMKNKRAEWTAERGDELFLLTLTLSVSDNNSMRVTMTIESKQVRHPIKRRAEDTKDVEVDVSDL